MEATWRIRALPYSTAATAWLARLRHDQFACLLESAGAPGERFDIIAAAPRVMIESTAGTTRCRQLPHDAWETLEADPFDAVQQLLEPYSPSTPCPLDLPFIGGAIGYFGYELGSDCQQRDLDLPDMAIGIFDVFIVIDHRAQASHLVATPRVDEDVFGRFLAMLDAPATTPDNYQIQSAIESSFTRVDYEAAITSIQRYINAGDCYQVNLTQRFHTGFSGDALALYRDISCRQRAAYSACLIAPDWQVLSFSPERFLQVDGDRVLTQPIKGTRPRGETEALDRQLARELGESEKDRAENLMIVDLLRNDLGRCCVPGSIKVDNLFELTSFRNVHHLVSTVSGQLRPGMSSFDILKSAFPGGSITGAPKVRAMQIIEELEPVQRGPYCGAIGYISYDGRMDTNLSIRTMACTHGHAYYWGGGGIVADSTAAGEYDESLAKVDFIRQTLLQHR